MENFSLKDKFVIVTGGTGILGNAFVDAIVEAGGSVGILGRKEDIANERANAIKAKGGKAIALVADVLNEKTIEVHRYNVLRKLNLKNAAALVNFVNKHQIDFPTRKSI